MKLQYISGFLVLLLLFTSCDLLSFLDDTNSSTTDTSENEIVNGLKEALVVGSKTAAFTLSDTSGKVNSLNEQTGYLANELIRISLPDDAQKAIATVNLLNNSAAGKTLLAVAGVDFTQYKEAMVRGLNRGAEKAADLSVDVFKSSIYGMTFTAARDILFGQDSTGATTYLKTTTSGVLTTGFTPIVDSAFSAVKVTAFGSQFTVKVLWSDFSINYNKVANAYQNLKTTSTSSNPVTSAAALLSLNAIAATGVSSVDPVNTDIVNFATGKALNGLFYMVGKQELKIRRDPAAALSSVANFVTQTISDLIKKVFTSRNT